MSQGSGADRRGLRAEPLHHGTGEVELDTHALSKRRGRSGGSPASDDLRVSTRDRQPTVDLARKMFGVVISNVSRGFNGRLPSSVWSNTTSGSHHEETKAQLES
jgi:hypothetical protein